MKPALMIDTSAALILNNRNHFMRGKPGIGKTTIGKAAVEKAAKQMGQPLGFFYHHGPTKLPEHFGVPVPNLARTAVNFVVPSKFPLEGDDSCPEYGVVMWDDAGQMDNAQQKIVANVIQEKELHGHRLKPGWVHIMTGNNVTDRAGANRMLTHFADRMSLYNVEVDHQDWVDWALDNGVATEVISFIRFKPDMLSNFDAGQEKNATPRGWVEGISAQIGKVPAAAEFETFAGGVGEGPATEFVAFLKVFRELPDPDAVLMSPDKYPVPTEPSVLYALSGALSVRVDEENFDRLVMFTSRMPPEFGVRTVQDVISRCPKVTHTRAFAQWASSEQGKAVGGRRA